MLTYSIGTGTEKNWIIGEKQFSLLHQGKCESIFGLANGYMGIRSAFEEEYPYQTRGMFLAGSYNSIPGETTELPNIADSCEMRIFLNGELFSMARGKVEEYERSLNLHTGELTRKLLWKSPMGLRYQMTFKRVVSQSRQHCYGIKVEICPINENTEMVIETGINARMTNSGVQHFRDGSKRILDQSFMYLEQTSDPGNLAVYHCCSTRANLDNCITKSYGMQRRKITEKMCFCGEKGKKASWEKLCVVYTGHDFYGVEEEYIQAAVLKEAKKLSDLGYDMLASESAEILKEYWKENGIEIGAENEKISLAVRFAQFHLKNMIPPDSRNSIAAKGLLGEGYKGHVFWDTEVFMLPYFLYTEPEKARQLLEYRGYKAEQAKQNAEDKGFSGYMFPWECCETGKEETPLFASMDILTGKAAHVWAGIKEHHITADIAYAVWLYYESTGDWRFMESTGNRIIVGSALFWFSRSTFDKTKNQYNILDIIGPDEYTEHIDNNTYTNYMAFYVVQKALYVLNHSSQKVQEEMEQYFGEEQICEKLNYFAEHLYLPKTDENGIIPQDDTFMSKQIIDVEKYRNDNVKQMILKKYGRKQVNQMQVLKQADTVMLLELLPDLFDIEKRRATWDYYEPKTIHDSSLSRAVYSVVASDNKEPEKAYHNFLEAIQIDMGQNPYSSDEGIHAAAMGGIWLSVFRGFAGVRVKENTLVISPCIPDEIRQISFNLTVRKKKIAVCINKEKIQVKCEEEFTMPLCIDGKMYQLNNVLEVNR